MNKSVTVEINGTSYPLCLTVAAMDELDTAGYGICDVSRLLSPSEDLTLEQLAKNSVWLLDILIREGEQNRHHLAEAGDELRSVPALETLCHMLTPAEAISLRDAMMAAVVASISMGVEVDREHQGNGDGTARA